MTANDNTVNIKSDESYHHGDLRAAALALGLEKLASLEVPDLGLRELARDLGVSATALYRHFPNKDALLDALALAALRKLGEEQVRAASEADAPNAFREVGFTYVRWAAQTPSLFRLIFARTGRIDALMDGSVDLGDAFRQLAKGIDGILPSHATLADRQAAQLHAWSIVHGIANLIVDGQVVWDETLVRAILARTFGQDRDAAGCD